MIKKARIPYGYRPIIANNLGVTENYITMVWNEPSKNKVLHTLIKLEIKQIERQEMTDAVSNYADIK